MSATYALYGRRGDGTYVRVGARGRTYGDALAQWQLLEAARRENRLPDFGDLTVRADDDPDLRWATARRLTGYYLPGHVFRDLTTAGRAVARHLGLTGRPGGWLYDRRGKPVMQGYVSVVAPRVGRVVPETRWLTAYDAAAGGYVLKRGLPAAHVPAQRVLRGA